MTILSLKDLRVGGYSWLSLPRVVLLASIALLVTVVVSWWIVRYDADAAVVPTTAGLVEESRRLTPDDRPEWLRISRGLLATESIQQIAAPVEPINNRGEATRVELGYLLFFDPVISGDRTTSCASCHHPDYGMADGMARGVGIGGHGYGPQRGGTGRELTRNTPSVFNSAFNNLQFWDGRAATLEEQALIPIFAEDEMNQTSVAELLRRLRAVPRYRQLFASAFGHQSNGDGSEITLPNITRAIAAFERKLNIVETAYDRFVRGDDTQLSTEQLRGMVVFFGQGQCAVCHIPPHFHDGVLASTGVPVSLEKGAPLDKDPGFGAVIRRRDAFGQFKTPGLRNISRTAPYMHNGIFRTLEEIVEFYNDGGGRGRGVEVISQDSKVEKLNLNSQQKADLISFLRSLDNLESSPAVPASVPSGLTPVGR